MERKMYKEKRELPAQETLELFAKGHHGILAVNGDDGYPYAVPVNYVFIDGKIYIHSAQYGYKIDALKNNNKVCFTTILHAQIIPDKFTAAFESVIAFGKATFVEDEAEKLKALQTFIDRFSPGFEENGAKFIKGAFAKTMIIRIDVEEIKGKAYRAGSSWN